MKVEFKLDRNADYAIKIKVKSQYSKIKEMNSKNIKDNKDMKDKTYQYTIAKVKGNLLYITLKEWALWFSKNTHIAVEEKIIKVDDIVDTYIKKMESE